MKPRRMRIDFKGVPLMWARDDGFSTIINSGSVLASAFEPYLNRVMAMARDVIPEDKTDVRRDIGLFIAQEGHHYRVHNDLNRELFRIYPRLKEFENEIVAAQQYQLQNWSLIDNLAYCVGFENLACYMAKFTYEQGLTYYEGVRDSRIATLFLWHNAEEFEHRTACSDALRALSSNYFVRIRGFIRFMRVIVTVHIRALAYMFEIDRAAMTAAQRAESIRFEKAYNRHYLGYMLPRMLQILVPFYDPRRQTAPAELHTKLGELDELVMQPEPLRA